MLTSIFVFVSNNCRFLVLDYSSNIKGYYVDIKKEKWGDKLDMKPDGTFFNKYLDGEPDKDCVYGRWEPGQTKPEDHMWETDKCNEKDKYLTLCQGLLCECTDFAH